jgi:hypothetical protein
MGANNIKMAVILCAEPAVFYSNLYIGLLCTYEFSLPTRLDQVVAGEFAQALRATKEDSRSEGLGKEERALAS